LNLRAQRARAKTHKVKEAFESDGEGRITEGLQELVLDCLGHIRAEDIVIGGIKGREPELRTRPELFVSVVGVLIASS
jgi:hypothetical protein